MPFSRQHKNRNSRQTPTATFTKKNSMWSTSLATLVNTPSTASATPVQQASHVDQISDLPTLPNENNASLEEQLKQQQLLINKLMSCIIALESYVQLLDGKIAMQGTVINLLEQMTWKPTPEDQAQFYQEFRNLRNRCGRISKHKFLKISRKLVYP